MRLFVRGLAMLALGLLLLGTAAGAQLWFRTPGEPLFALAERVPAQASLFVAADFTGVVSLRQSAADLRDLLIALEGAGTLEEVEAELGQRIDALADGLSPRGFLVLLKGPRPEVVGAVQAEDGAAFTALIGRVAARSGFTVDRQDELFVAKDGDQPVFAFGSHQGFVLLATSSEALRTCLQPAAPLARDGNFRQAWREVSLDKGLFVYAPVGAAARLIAEQQPELASSLQDIPYLVGAADFREDGVLYQGLLRVTPGSPLARALLGTPSEVDGSGARFVPGSWDMYTAINVRYLVEAGLKLAAQHPELREAAEIAPGMLEMTVGVSLDEVWQATTGELGLSSNGLLLLAEGSDPEDLEVLAAIALKDRAAAERLVSFLVDRYGLVRADRPGGVACLAELGLAYAFVEDHLLLCYGGEAEEVLAGARAADPGLLARLRQRSLPEARHTIALSYVDLRPTLDRLLESLDRTAAEDADLKPWQELARRFRQRLSTGDSLARLEAGPHGLRYTGSGPREVIPLVAGGALAGAWYTRSRLRPVQAGAEACGENLKRIGTALERYSLDHGGSYPEQLTGIAPAYLQTLPTCPQAGYDTYSDAYRAATDSYTVLCEGAHHMEAGYPPDRPMYSSRKGLIRE